MTQCRRCHACEEHCLCTQPDFRTVEVSACYDCRVDEETGGTINRPDSRMAEPSFEDEEDDDV